MSVKRRKFQMKLSFLAALLSAALLLAQQAMPRLNTVEPALGKAGDVLTASGENLQKPGVSKLFLTDGKNDVEVQVTDQAATSMKFKLPDAVKPGRFSLMILTGGSEPKYIEQPVKVTIE
jgi:hypothetical protein